MEAASNDDSICGKGIVSAATVTRWNPPMMMAQWAEDTSTSLYMHVLIRQRRRSNTRTLLVCYMCSHENPLMMMV